MRRREFITLAGAAAACIAGVPSSAHAETGERLRRAGVLVSGAERDPEMQARLAGFKQGLGRLGWWEGRNIRIDYRFASASADQARIAAKELVALQPDVLVGLATAVVEALQRETRTIPIVFIGIPDPVASGFVASLARPGGNLTGTLLHEQSIVGKWLSMLKEVSPQTTRVAILENPKTASLLHRRAAEAIAPSLGLEIVVLPIETADDIERAMAAFAATPNGALLVGPDLTAVLHRGLIIALAIRHRLPAVYQARFWVTAGGLMSYGTDRIAAFREAAYHVDRVLRGESPATLPVQGPTKFETVINLNAAKAVGLSFPPGLLVAADEVIE